MHQALLEQDPSVPQSARATLEIGQNHDGYWNNEKFMEQMKVAVKVAEAKYPHIQTRLGV